VAARRDPALVLLGRTAALKVEGTEGAVRRAKAFAACGVDAIFLVGVEAADQVKAVRDAARLPVMVGSAPASIRREDFAAAGARVLLQGHQPLPAAVKALREVYQHLYRGGATADLKDRIASPKEMDALVGGEAYKRWQRDYLR
jgi:carboxyvinyl-carboxyphosphonate phosphorylmutase